MNLKLILKGFIVGIGKIIPGVSGSMLAYSLGIYEPLMEAVMPGAWPSKVFAQINVVV